MTPPDDQRSTAPDPHSHHGAGHHHANCDEALEELYLYLDGELTEERRVTIRTHLEDCSGCFEAFDFEAELRLVIAHRCRDEVPEAFRDKIASLLDGDLPSSEEPDEPSR